MIRTEKGIISIKGSNVELGADLSIIVRTLKEQGFSEEKIMYSVNMGFLSEDKVNEKVKEARRKLMEDEDLMDEIIKDFIHRNS